MPSTNSIICCWTVATRAAWLISAKGQRTAAPPSARACTAALLGPTSVALRLPRRRALPATTLRATSGRLPLPFTKFLPLVCYQSDPLACSPATSGPLACNPATRRPASWHPRRYIVSSFHTGRLPYDDRAWPESALYEQTYDDVLNGAVLPQPQLCPTDVYTAMLDAWNLEPALRPTADVRQCCGRMDPPSSLSHAPPLSPFASS